MWRWDLRFSDEDVPGLALPLALILVLCTLVTLGRAVRCQSDVRRTASNHMRQRRGFSSKASSRRAFLFAMICILSVSSKSTRAVTVNYPTEGMAAGSETSTPPTITPDPPSHFFVVCTVNGHIIVLDAYNGHWVSGFTGGDPLVGPSDVLPGQRRIVPGLDGRLYVSHVETDGDGHGNILHPLELTVMDVLQNPVKTCSQQPNEDGGETTTCGIVTATKSTSLLALDAVTGELVWHQASNGTTTRADTSQDAEPLSTVLLQREDVLVQQLSTESGKSVWNATLGSVQALEFGDSDHLPPGTGDRLPGDASAYARPVLMDDQPEPLPSVLFSNDGLSLTAVANGRPIWKQEFSTVVASVFGLEGKVWKPLTVIEDESDDDSQTRPASNARLLSPPSSDRFSPQGASFHSPPDSGITVYRAPHRLVWQALRHHANQLNSFIETLVYPYWRPQESMTSYSFTHGLQHHDYPGSSDLSPKKNTLPDLQFHYPGPWLHEQYLALPAPTELDENLSLRNGLFLTWPVMVALLGVVLIVAAFVFRFVYIKKKNKWIELLKQLTSPSKMINATNSTRTSSVSFAEHDEIPVVSMEPHGNPKFLRRSHSLPEVHHRQAENSADAILGHAHASNGSLDNLLNIDIHSVHPASPHGKTVPEDDRPLGSSTVTTGVPTTTSAEPTGAQGVGFLVDGIPLIRYSRYASEFTEVVALGKGGFGTVFRGQNVLDGREYAIKKVILRYDSRSPEEEFSQRLQRTLREVKSLALLDHPNIVRYYTAWLELEQKSREDTNNPDGHSAYPDSDYYMFSPTHSKNTAQCFSSQPIRRRPSLEHVTENDPSYNGKWRKKSINDDSLSRLVPGIPSPFEDIGITFDRSEASDSSRDQTAASNIGASARGFFQQRQSSIDESTTGWSKESEGKGGEKESDSTKEAESSAVPSTDASVLVRHILYIQMQFCSQKTLADFLRNKEARGGDSVDIPYALNLFLQICQGVQHVHSQGLIHRDLKPNNCFMDDAGSVKVGDFGLSRESGENLSSRDDEDGSLADGGDGSGDEITAGVGTRSYASPEQMDGSDYDASTDIYSLGIILFELCYPMYTGMERHIVLSKLRNHIFPEDWIRDMKPSFPILHPLLLSMISNSPGERPTAETVVHKIQSILEGFTITSLDKQQHREGSVLLRVEAKPRQDVLRHTTQILKEAALPDVLEIIQYGLRGGDNKAIMEFAVVCTTCDISSLGDLLVSRTRAHPEVLLVRQVSATKYA